MSGTADSMLKLGWTHLNVHMRCLRVVVCVGECVGTEFFTHPSCFSCHARSIIMQLRSSFLSYDTLFPLWEHVELFERGFGHYLVLSAPWFKETLKHCKPIDDFCTNIPVHGFHHPLHVHCCFLCSALLFTFISLLWTRSMSPSRLGKHSTSK